MKSFPDHLKSIRETLLYAYIWQIPFSWRIIFDPSRSQWNPHFSEYMDLSIYLGEVFIAFALITHILEYKINKKSIISYLKEKWYKLFHVEHGIPYFAFGILLVSINLLLSIDPLLSLVSLLHIASLIGFIVLFLNIYVSRGTKFVRNVLIILFFSLFVQCAIAFLQVLNSSSIGLIFLNESRLSLEIENVAKSNIFSNTFLRGYGTFLHPNILAAYAILVAVFSIFIHRSNLFHVKHYLQASILIVSGITITLSQSKLALTLFFLLLVWYINEKFKLFHVKQLLKYIAIVILVSIPSLIILNHDAGESFQTRVNQFSFQFKTTPKEFFIGSGLGTYRLSYDEPAANWWIYEPVHLVPIIVLKELGIFISMWLLAYLIILTVHVPHETFNRTAIAGAFILYVAITDHFFWDIYQGSSFVAISVLILYIDIKIEK